MAVLEFFKRFSINELVQVLAQAYKRFPLPTALTGLSLLLLLARTHGIAILPDDLLGKTLLFFMQGFLYGIAIQILSESRKMSSTRKWALILAGYLVLATLIYIPNHFLPMQPYIITALLLFISFAPYVGRGSTEDSVWYYNYLNILTILLACISTLIFCLGLSAIVASVTYLFEIHGMSAKIYADIWTLGWSFLFPVFFLSQLPPKFDFEKQECSIATGIYFIANYLLVPLSLIYMFVLYAYFIKILLQWELPRGNLAYMVTGFGVVGVLTHLAVYPMRETGTRLLQQFYSHFYTILIVPILLLALGIYTRISQYGLTEERYALALCFLWLSGLSVLYVAYRRHAHVKYVPMLLCILALIASTGPLGAVSLSVTSQTNRLGVLLTKVGVLDRNEYVIGKAPAEISFEDRKSISSIVDYLSARHAFIKIAAWTAPFQVEIDKESPASSSCITRFGFPCNKTDDLNKGRKILEAWGVTYVPSWEKNELAHQNVFNVSVPYNNINGVVKVSPYEYMVRVHTFPSVLNHDWTQKETYKDGGGEIQTAVLSMTENGNFTLSFPGNRKVVFSLQSLADDFYKKKITAVPEDKRDTLILHKKEDGIDAMLQIFSMNGKIVDGYVILGGAEVMVLFTPLHTEK